MIELIVVLPAVTAAVESGAQLAENCRLQKNLFGGFDRFRYC